MIKFSTGVLLSIKDIKLFRKEARRTGAYGGYPNSKLPHKFMLLGIRSDNVIVKYLYDQTETSEVPPLHFSQRFYSTVLDAMQPISIAQVPLSELYKYIRYTEGCTYDNV